MSGRAGPALAMELEIPEPFARLGLTVEGEVWGPTWVMLRDMPLGAFPTDGEAMQFAWRVAGDVAARRRISRQRL